MTKIVLFGATGFVGGDVFHQLLQQGTSACPGLDTIVAPVSSNAKRQRVGSWLKSASKQSGITVDIPVAAREPAEQWYKAAEEMSSKADVVLQLATSDDLELTSAINRGLKNSKSGKKVLIHASGVQLIESEPNGKYVQVPKYDDSKPQSIADIPDDAAHRSIDVAIDEEYRKGSLRGAIICPALVWGKGKGPDNQMSVMVPDMVRKALHNGKGTYVGEGTNEWVHVHVDEVSDLVIRLIQKHVDAASKPATEAWANFFFVSNNSGRVQFKHIAAVIGKTLHEAGKISSSETTSVPAPKFGKGMKGVRIEDAARSEADAEEDARTPLWPTRTNCDCISQRGKDEVGWEAKLPYDEAAIANDVHVVLASS